MEEGAAERGPDKLGLPIRSLPVFGLGLGCPHLAMVLRGVATSWVALLKWCESRSRGLEGSVMSNSGGQLGWVGVGLQRGGGAGKRREGGKMRGAPSADLHGVFPPRLQGRLPRARNGGFLTALTQPGASQRILLESEMVTSSHLAGIHSFIPGLAGFVRARSQLLSLSGLCQQPWGPPA